MIINTDANHKTTRTIKIKFNNNNYINRFVVHAIVYCMYIKIK